MKKKLFIAVSLLISLGCSKPQQGNPNSSPVPGNNSGTHKIQYTILGYGNSAYVAAYIDASGKQVEVTNIRSGWIQTIIMTSGMTASLIDDAYPNSENDTVIVQIKVDNKVVAADTGVTQSVQYIIP